jgi:hypothetical protein
LDTVVVVKITNFNNKNFNSFINKVDVKTHICHASGLELLNNHGSTFIQDEEDKSLLNITFKLNHPIFRDQINCYFWYLKESSAQVD